MRSMTAFGRATGQTGGRFYVCEIKSVNNRFLDCTVKLPRQLSFLEQNVIELVSSRGISRGKVDVFVSVEDRGTKGVTASVDTEYADTYVAALNQLRERYCPDSPPPDLTMIASNPQVFMSVKAADDEDGMWDELFPYISSALDSFVESGRAEGERLKADLLSKLDALGGMAAEIASKSEANAAGYREKLEQRLRRTLGELDIKADENRILTEVALFCDKIAVDEETTRLGSHFEAFRAALGSDEPVGRRLDFLVQEMNREINTIGSKSCDSAIASVVVSAKCELEKIREQIQNLE
ncbi:MAG: YicC family protein [Clostridia bacterium]|nr:YicC family protein [Clostridia bacterium]